MTRPKPYDKTHGFPGMSGAEVIDAAIQLMMCFITSRADVNDLIEKAERRWFVGSDLVAGSSVCVNVTLHMEHKEIHSFDSFGGYTVTS